MKKIKKICKWMFFVTLEDVTGLLIFVLIPCIGVMMLIKIPVLWILVLVTITVDLHLIADFIEDEEIHILKYG